MVQNFYVKLHCNTNITFNVFENNILLCMKISILYFDLVLPRIIRCVIIPSWSTAGPGLCTMSSSPGLCTMPTSLGPCTMSTSLGPCTMSSPQGSCTIPTSEGPLYYLILFDPPIHTTREG